MSKKHRHRRRCKEKLELIPRNNVFLQNSPQGIDDSSLMFIGVLKMLISQFNLFGNKKENDDKDLSSNVQLEDEDNTFVNEDTVKDIEDINIDNIDEVMNINNIELIENQDTTKCKDKVYNNTVLEYCVNKNIKSKFIKEPVVTKLPVIISEIEVPIYIETLTKFNEAFLKIIDVDKEVFLENCYLINNSNKLFIKGYIRENITYANINSITDYAVSGNIRCLEMDIPFKCSTKIRFNTSPILNDKIFCKLDSINILETTSQEDIKVLKNKIPKTYTSKGITKKIMLNLGLSLIQEQYVFISN